MSKLIIVAHRLPVGFERRNGRYQFRTSVGGVATGLDSLRKAGGVRWIGAAEMSANRMGQDERDELAGQLRSRFDAEPVFLTRADVVGSYQGLSNRTIWPLFHYFSRYAEFLPEFWRSYERVNKKFRDAVVAIYEPGDRIWVHDYQLMLLPGMLRQELPDAAVGYFMHIPFPSFELFRLLPWRRELLEGVLGANLIGFHTHDYVRHFLGTVHALLGIENRTGFLRVNDRLALVDVFPMGIDCARYSEGAKSQPVMRERAKLGKGGERIVLSVDRLDYTKGIPERLRAFNTFLELHPEWRGRVSLVCVAVPSRSRVWRYRQLKYEVDELVGSINGHWGTMQWTPVRYLYRQLSFNALVALYAEADVALVTPLRDGMNLVAKEYLAAHKGRGGVLVLSEMAGAAHELVEAVIVNPHDENAVAEAIAEALTMPMEEQVANNEAMLARLERYDVRRWAADFLQRLDEVMMRQLGLDEYVLTAEARSRLVDAARSAARRLIVLDYDGTLTPIKNTPGEALPSEELLGVVRALTADPRTDVVIASGRDRADLDAWFGRCGANLIADHGAWVREPGEEWAMHCPLDTSWKSVVRTLLETYVDRTPGAFVEEKEHTIAWHYRLAHKSLARRRLQELTESVAPLAKSLNLSLLDGHRVLEIRPSCFDKGTAAFRWFGRTEYDFVLAMGDDVSDEDLFTSAPATAWTIKVGCGVTAATFCVDSQADVLPLLVDLVGDSTAEAGAQAAAAPAYA